MLPPSPIDRSPRLRIIVGGLIGLLPAGGVTWDYLQYPLGLRELGHDVYYLEDTRLWPIFQRGDPNAVGLDHLRQAMEAVGLGDRWAYRDEASSQWLGMTETDVHAILKSADLLINVSCATCLNEDYLAIPARALIDSDPMFTQVQYLQDRGILAEQGGIRQQVDGHTHHFSFGERIGAEGCRIPATGHRWIPTRQPICLRHWPVLPLPDSGAAFTTVMNWSAARELEFDGERWGQKDRTFAPLIDLPRQLPGLQLAMALSRRLDTPFPEQAIRAAGWRLLDPETCAGDWRRYRQFIQSSLGEFSVAKEAYVKAATGWFSCRSACYLASGRPVITQDTGWTAQLPHDEGLLAFRSPGEAAEALRRVAAEPQRHGREARRIAERCFDSGPILQTLLQDLGA